MPVHFKKQAQIKTQVGALLFNEAPTEVLTQYSDYNNVFSIQNIVNLLENTKLNEHAIELKEDKQLLFGSIYSLGLIELKTLKIYIKISLANGFIWLSKSPAKAFILFDKKPDKKSAFM